MVQTMVAMPRFARINSIKHVLDAGGGLTSTSADVPLAVAVPNVDTTTFKPGDVRVGSHVNGMFIIVNIIGATGAPVSGPVDWYIAKFHEGQLGSAPTPGNTGVSKIRNQIFHEEKGVPGSGDGTPNVFKGVIAVPRSMRRMREGDSIRIFLKMSTPDSGTFCVKAIFKSFF